LLKKRRAPFAAIPFLRIVHILCPGHFSSLRPTPTTHEAARSLPRIFEPTDYPRFYPSLTEKGGDALKSAYFSHRGFASKDLLLAGLL
jgi:hypothetical protein